MDNQVEIGATRYRLSDWHDGSLAPWERGVYMRLPPDGPYALWDGRRWRREADEPDAAAEATALSANQFALWRGLAVPAAQAVIEVEAATSEVDADDAGVPGRTGAGDSIEDIGDGSARESIEASPAERDVDASVQHGDGTRSSVNTA